MGRWRAIALLTFGWTIVAACGGRTSLDQVPFVTDAAATDADAGPPRLTQSNKLDMLFAIDNSASMGDKQDILALAIPHFLARLTSPWCVPKNDPTNIAVPPVNGQCPSGTIVEFKAVDDIHVGIVSSSLGGGGAPDVCAPSPNNDATHQDDHGHLLARTFDGTTESTLAAAKALDGNGGNFLAWLPANEKANVPNEPSEVQLTMDFSALVGGVQEHGCGLEAQLESWYRFLVQPDPYDHIAPPSGIGPASLVGVDATLLKQRHDFLRPDSLVLIVQITDEEDSWSDPLWLGGFGWASRTLNFPGGPGNGAGPRGTHECDAPVDSQSPATTGENNSDCTSCAFPANDKPNSGTPIGADPNCNACAGGASSCPQKGWYTPSLQPNVTIGAADGLNVRYTNDMRRRYGIDPQWNIQRYVDGLKSRTVPDRDHETHDAAQYASTVKNCENPLFAKSLPDGSDTSPAALCNLPDGDRDTSLVYYLIIGGVPWQLLAQDALNTSLPLKRTLDTADWRRIVGTDPATHQLDGIDPHMIESITPRAGLEAPGSGYSLGGDVENGREWNTLTSNAGLDLQYACVFGLDEPKNCAAAEVTNACDCTGTATTAPDGPPLCDPNNRAEQIRGKAYPTIRELRVAQGLDKQGVVASICPRVTPPVPTADSYFEVLFTRIRSSISAQ